SSAVPSPWMLPPILMTTVLPTYREMYGNASLMAAASTIVSSPCLTSLTVSVAVFVATVSSGGVGAVLDDVRLREVAAPCRRRPAAHGEVRHEGDLLLFHHRFRCFSAARHRRTCLDQLDAPDEQVDGVRIDGRAGVADRAQHPTPVRIAAVDS